MLKYLSKITMDIFPSVLATIIGAYIVNHYINAKAVDAPVASVVSPADPKGKPAETSAVPGPGVTARGFSEKAVEKVETRPVESKSADAKSVETKATETKPAEAANAASEPHHHAPTLREKVIAKIMPTRTPAPSPAPVAAPPAAPAEAAAPAASEEHKDATDLARAAIQRLRNAQEGAPRVQETTARASEPPRAAEPVRTVAEPSPAVRPLPPPITVSSPAPETLPANPPYASAVRADPNRPIPPADIPLQPAPPVDLRADAAIAAPRERANVAEDVLSAAKSVFQSVLPKSPAAD